MQALAGSTLSHCRREARRHPRKAETGSVSGCRCAYVDETSQRPVEPVVGGAIRSLWPCVGLALLVFDASRRLMRKGRSKRRNPGSKRLTGRPGTGLYSVIVRNRGCDVARQATAVCSAVHASSAARLRGEVAPAFAAAFPAGIGHFCQPSQRCTEFLQLLVRGR